jgi:small subunit ribosomal protein S20
MPQSASAAKRLRQNETRREINRAARSRLRTQLKAFEKAIKDGNRVQAQQEMLKSHSFLDKAAGKGLVKKNYSDRKKARMTRSLSSLPVETTSATAAE